MLRSSIRRLTEHYTYGYDWSAALYVALLGPQTFFPNPPTHTPKRTVPTINHVVSASRPLFSVRSVTAFKPRAREENPGDAVAVAVSGSASGINHPWRYPPQRLTFAPTCFWSVSYARQYIHTLTHTIYPHTQAPSQPQSSLRPHRPLTEAPPPK
ncbi:hypothetical protein QTP88_025458 [Uroleucon formosanum]